LTDMSSNTNNLEETARNFLIEQKMNSVAQWEKRKKPDIDTGSDKPGAASPNSLEEDNLEEGTFKYYMSKAIAADSRGDSKKRKYHLDSAKTALYALKSSEYPKHRDLLDKYKEMRADKKSLEEDSVEESTTGYNMSRKLSEAREKSFAKVSKKKESEKQENNSNKNKTDTGQSPDFVDFRPNKNELTNN